MCTHKMKLEREPFEKIIRGQKIIESRLYDEKRRQINIGDHIEFISIRNPSKKILTKVKALYRYGSFKDLFSDLPSDYFGSISKTELIREIKTFYSEDEERKYGVIGIKIELLK